MEIPLIIPDLWQQEAIRALRNGEDVVVQAPTGSGKTLIFELAVQGLKGQAVYTVPTRALANDKLREWRDRGWNVGIATGDVAENLNAPILVATLETQRAKFLAGNGPKLLVVDEYQLLADPNRGVAYELALALSPRSTQILLLSGSVANPSAVVDWLRRLGRPARLVSTEKRPVPLDEIMLPGLSIRVASSIKGRWPRLLAAALASDLGPILVFAPRRAATEELARALAAAIPCLDPLVLTEKQNQMAGDPLNKFLKQRIAFHHSGLSYSARAGVVEPLAKAGKLRIVVATTGLAAGVNFSMRSVLVTDTRYFSGPYERHLRPDELLQMFGRAGRRGLDSVGYVLTTEYSPRIHDGQPLSLTRANQVDWPSLISVMASTEAQPPFRAAVDVTAALFSHQRVPIGVENSLADGPRPCGLWVDSERAKFARPRLVEMLNSKGNYEPLPQLELGTLGELRLHREGRWTSALRLPDFLNTLPESTLRFSRINRGPNWFYGPEFYLGSKMASGQIAVGKEYRNRWRAKNQPLRKFLDLPDFELFANDPSHAPPGVRPLVTERGSQFFMVLDYSQLPARGYRDSHGRLLQDPPLRKVLPHECENCPRFPVCESASITSTPALAWRTMGLVDNNGTPTRRGIIFSFFHQGEGLTIAAALEDSTFAPEDLLFELANLRAGHRFKREDIDQTPRLGATCRRLFGHVDYPGYLELGLPPNYGEGAAEIVQAVLANPAEKRKFLSDLVRVGDIERAMLEWRSLLRQIHFAPHLDWDRWLELKAHALKMLDKLASPAIASRFPTLS